MPLGATSSSNPPIAQHAGAFWPGGRPEAPARVPVGAGSRHFNRIFERGPTRRHCGGSAPGRRVSITNPNSNKTMVTTAAWPNGGEGAGGEPEAGISDPRPELFARARAAPAAPAQPAAPAALVAPAGGARKPRKPRRGRACREENLLSDRKSQTPRHAGNRAAEDMSSDAPDWRCAARAAAACRRACGREGEAGDPWAAPPAPRSRPSRET
jgi:hypothetical protein